MSVSKVGLSKSEMGKGAIAGSDHYRLESSYKVSLEIISWGLEHVPGLFS